MIDPEKRKAIYRLHQAGLGVRKISRSLGISRNTVREIIKCKAEMPTIARKDKIEVDPDLLRKLYAECDGYKERGKAAAKPKSRATSQKATAAEATKRSAGARLDKKKSASSGGKTAAAPKKSSSTAIKKKPAAPKESKTTGANSGLPKRPAKSISKNANSAKKVRGRSTQPKKKS